MTVSMVTNFVKTIYDGYKSSESFSTFANNGYYDGEGRACIEYQ